MPFKEILGHEQQIARLVARIQNRRCAGAYLFCGPEGTGKKLVALTFAQAVNCLKEPHDACGGCASCVKIARNTHPDVHVIDKDAEAVQRAAVDTDLVPARESRRKANVQSQEIRIDDIRHVQQEIALRPYEARFKVFIVNDAHMLNPESSNAFLKTLEEPPKDSLIILVTDKPRLLYKTIVSRCRVVKFSALPAEELTRELMKRRGFDSKTVRYLAHACEGRLGSALASGTADCLAEKNRIIDYFILRQDLLAENSFIRERSALRQSLQVLCGWFRDIYVCKAGFMDDRHLINADRSELLARMAARTTFARLDEIIQTLQDSLLALEQNANTKLVLACVLSGVQ